ncbi:MAG TPA: glycosyltransferase family 4 protein [Verrucomicrobiae bacterium]|nr:glycosyltransferase family 4 protein [Verrucomicrobiae bacterium]
MAGASSRPRIAVVSPFLDKRHGTERRAVEWITQLAGEFEIHVYSQRAEDVDLSTITWHRIPRLPGPHLFNFLWWVAANRLWRGFDSRFRGLHYNLVFSPGVNCLDADAVSVHIVFGEYLRQVESKMRFRDNRVSAWPRLAHRKLYYRLLVSLERRVYSNPQAVLVLIAKKTGEEITRHYGRGGPFPVLYLGIDHATFNPSRRAELRPQARESLGLARERFALLLIGNDWRNKGVPVLLESLEQLRSLPVDLLVVSAEDAAACASLIAERRLEERVRLLPPQRDVELYYAAADAYVGPSLEDTFALPPAEAMACGLPVIVSSANGACEIITGGHDGLVLPDPRDSVALAAMIRRLVEDRAFGESLGRNAAATALRFTWERNGRDLAAIFEQILARKTGEASQTFAPGMQNR